MSRSIRIFIIILIPLLAGIFSYSFMKKSFTEPVNKADSKMRLVEIEAGKFFGDICAKIKDAGVVKYCWSLDLLARLKKVDTAIQAGEYELNPAMTPTEILDKLKSGKRLERKITVKEGESIWTIGKSLQDAGILPKEEWDKAMVSRDLLVRAGINADTFEGYLFPETYSFSRPIKAQAVIWRMIEEGEKKWTQEFTNRADELRLSRHDILTLASIIEKESGNVDEQANISSVFHNRLNNGMKLQSDPTVIYGIPNFDGNLTKKDLETPSQYNTYISPGLPPGPICNPGSSSIRAALFPNKTSYLFFVGDGHGQHVFSTTLAEHNDAVRRFQKEPAAAAAAAAAAAGK